MAEQPIRLGITGASAERGWAKDAHLAALAHLPRFQISAVSAPTLERARAAATAFGASSAFADSLELARSPNVDVVVVTVRVPDHRNIVMAAIEAGKDIFCEWPLGRTLAEAEEMAAAAAKAKVRTMVGLQALGSPAVRRAAEIVKSGALGQITSARLISPSTGWGATAPQVYAYLSDKENGATLSTIPGGHALAAITEMLGDFVTVQAQTAIHHPEVRILETGHIVKRTCADHLSVLGTHANGCVTTVELAGGYLGQTNAVFEVSGSKAQLRLVGTDGGPFQAAALTLETDVAHAEPGPAALPGQGAAVNVGELYSMLDRRIAGVASEAADFTYAVRVHRLLEAIDAAAQTGVRQSL